jgi:hypothetical protein
MTTPKVNRRLTKPTAYRRFLGAATSALTVLCLAEPLHAQPRIRVNVAGAAFSPERGAADVVIEDVADGRGFRGKSFSLLSLKAVMPMPPSGSAPAGVQGVAVHFRTSVTGPKLESVELRTGSQVLFHVDSQLQGDYISRDTTRPDVVANAWVFAQAPILVTAQSLIRLQVRFPGGIDSEIDPGEFFLKAVAIDFPRRLPTTTTLDPPAASAAVNKSKRARAKVFPKR